jgi:hypothetical protein
MKSRVSRLKLAGLLAMALSCASIVYAAPYRTQHVIVAVIDGVAYRTSFGDPTHANIPKLWGELRPQGTLYSNFYNNGVTITKGGHSTIMTGTWQQLRNRGPTQTRPTIIDYMADEIGLKPREAWIIFGKGNYAYSVETSLPTYRGLYQPEVVLGLGEETYAGDPDVLEHIKEAMQKDRPKFILANFGVTDHTAHSGRWDVHLGAVRNADSVIRDLWLAIQSDPNYKDLTTLVITNDHGYMDFGDHEGFAEHGDASEGSRHIMLLILGPDTPIGKIVDTPAYQVDIAPTVGELLGFQTPLAQGVVLKDALASYQHVNRGTVKTPREEESAALVARAGSPLETTLAKQTIKKYEHALESLKPSESSTLLMWGMLAAYDRTRDAEILGFVRRWVSLGSSDAAADTLWRDFVRAELCYRDPDRKYRDANIDALKASAKRALDGLETGRDGQSGHRFLLSVIFGASVAELSAEVDLWKRAADLYIEQVRSIDKRAAIKSVTDVHRETERPDTESGEITGRTGKVLPASDYRIAGPDDPWYLLAAAFIRGHGLPFKGEDLADVPFFRNEVLYRSALVLLQLPGPGALWPNDVDSAINLAAIREARRRISSASGEIFDGADALTQSEVAELRPDSPGLLAHADTIKQTIRAAIHANYNRRYGYPRYEDLDFSFDLLRLHVKGDEDDGMRGLLMLALDESPRVRLEPFVPTPRR